MGFQWPAMDQNSDQIFRNHFLKLLVLSVCLCEVQCYCVSHFDKLIQEAIFVNLTDESIYKKWMRPHSDHQLMVNTSMEVYSMASVNERDSEFTLNLLIDLLWNDQRLAHNNNNSNCAQLNELSIEGSEWHLDRIWSPKLRVPSNKNPAALDRDAKIILLRVKANGDVRVRKRLILDLNCELDFRYYPFDEQVCLVRFISSDLSEEQLALEWTVNESAFISSESSYMTGYELIRIDPHKHLKSGNITSKGEIFSSVSIEFHLKREWSHFLLDIYLPSILVVIVSWISFWMEITATPARITLGVTTLLTFVTVSKDSREDLPNISYVNAMDIWFVVCTGFIFLSLIEFIIITYISRAEKRKIKQMKTLRRNISQSQFDKFDKLSLSSSSAETQTTFTTNDNLFLSPPRTPNYSSRFPFDGIEIKVPKSPRVFERQTSEVLPTSLNHLKLTITPPQSPNPDVESKSSGVQFELKLTPVEIAEAIDRKCRIIFPLAFTVFNVMYWIIVSLAN